MNILQNFNTPAVETLERPTDLPSLPQIPASECALENPFTPCPIELTPLSIAGSTVLANRRRVTYHQISSNITFQQVSTLTNLSQTKAEDRLNRWVQKNNNHPTALAFMHTFFSIENSTKKQYLNKYRQIYDFAKRTLPWKNRKFNPQQLITIKDLPDLVIRFLTDKGEEHVAKNTLKGYVAAIIFFRKLFNLPPLTKRALIRTTINSIARRKSKRPVGTTAIPLYVLRHLLKYLRRIGARHFGFFALSLWAGSRASEARNIKPKHFRYFKTNQGKSSVEITFHRPKTKKQFMDDHHKVIFTRSKDSYKCCPYRAALFFTSRIPPNDYIAPFGQGTEAQRTSKQYLWFQRIKKGFAEWYLQETGKEIDTSKWRFHSIRTTLVGILRKGGLDWDQIQLRVGHVLDSKTTRQTYYMNALLTEGFDDSFERLLNKNSEIESLLESDFSDNDSSTGESDSNYSDTFEKKDFISHNKKANRAFIKDWGERLFNRPKRRKKPGVPCALQAYRNLQKKFFHH